MTKKYPVITSLTAHTVPSDFPGLAAASRQQPLYWRRGNFELIGIGTALRLEFFGANRFQAANQSWAEIVANSSETNFSILPGTGLLAFTSFSFSAHSKAASALIVPKVIYGRLGNRAWRTDIVTQASSASCAQPALDSAEFTTEISESSAAFFLDNTSSATNFTAAVRQATAQIAATDFEKVVLSRTIKFKQSEPVDYRIQLARLTERFPNCWTFAVDGMMGSSPETLLEISDAGFSVRVLAGTAARGSSPDSDLLRRNALLSSAKDRQEHRLAVESALTALRGLTSTLIASESYPLQLPNLWHIATDLHGKVTDGTTPLEIIGALHPTAAVAGTPTDVALDAINDLELFDRGRYAGPTGWLDSRANGQWAIALRSAETSKTGEVTAYAGCGIVADSTPDAELRETSIKFRPILDAFQLQEP